MTADNEGDKGYGNLHFVFSVFNHLIGRLILVLMFMCVLTLLYSLFIISPGFLCPNGNRLHASVHGTGTMDLKFSSKKIV
jgi:hypothetical protein